MYAVTWWKNLMWANFRRVRTLGLGQLEISKNMNALVPLGASCCLTGKYMRFFLIDAKNSVKNKNF